MINPAPKKQSRRGCVSVSPAVFLSGDCADLAAGFFAGEGVPLDGGLKVELKLENSEELTYIRESRCLTDEKYIIDTDDENGELTCVVRFSSPRSLKYAVSFLADCLLGGELPLGTTEDYPLFLVRGFIEGFYGHPWSFEERRSAIELMGKKRMNTYYYAPKDDPYHREKWRELYPEEEYSKLGELVKLCADNYMEFCWCIAPGLSVRYSSQSDFDCLLNKLKSVYAAGVRGFGLLLDDIPEKLYYAEDIEMFGAETVNAHIYLANKVYDSLRELDPEISLTVCPMQYHGTGNEYFISKLGRGLEPDVRLFWTGHNICSQELTVPEAITFITSTRHKPFYWDNYPVNDAEMYNEMHLGPILGRDPELYRYSVGLIANCMEFAEATKLPLMTVADYLWSPEDYDPAASWEIAVRELTGEDAERFTLFADNLRFSCLKDENSPIFNAAAAAMESELGAGNPGKALEILTDYYIKLRDCCDTLNASDKKLYKELDRWLKKQTAACDLLGHALEMLKSGDEGKKEEVRAEFGRYLRIPEVLMDFSFAVVIERMLEL